MLRLLVSLFSLASLGSLVSLVSLASLVSVASVVMASAATAQGTVTPVGPPHPSGDDTAQIQQILSQGDIAALTPGATYTIQGTLLLSQKSGIITLQDPPATIRLGSAFSNFVPPSGAGPVQVAIRAGDGANDIRLERFTIEGPQLDGSYICAIWLQGSVDATIKNVEIWGFSIGSLVRLDSVRRASVRNCTIRDSWASRVDPNVGFTTLPQLTGIAIDDTRVFDGDVPRDSDGIVIANNTIKNLRFRAPLYQLPRKNFNGNLSGVVAFETDGINIMNRARNVLISGNVLDTVGEHIDNFALNVVAEHNVMRNAYLFAIKLIHGGSDSTFRDNVIEGCGISGIVVAGSDVCGAGNSFGNLFYRNRMKGLGAIPAFETFGPFQLHPTIPLAPGPLSGGARAIQIQTGSVGPCTEIPLYNVFFDNYAEVTEACTRFTNPILVQSLARESHFHRNTFALPPGSFPNVVNTPPGETEIDQPVAFDSMIVVDGDGNGQPDVFLHRKDTGQNRLFRKIGRDVVRVDDVIDIASINGSPDHAVTGDFNGDGRGDLFFAWRSLAIGRLFQGQADGTFFEVVGSVVSPADAAMAEVVRVGDFDGDGRSDVFLYNPATGQNVTYSGTSSGFANGVTHIPAASINASPDDALVGDFDGDGRSDLLFLRRVTGENRFFYGAPSGPYAQVLDPIDPASINEGADRVWVCDLDYDGRSDITFLWFPTDERRAFLGQANRTPIFD